MTVRADPAVPTKTQVTASSAEAVVRVATESFRDRRMDRLAEGRRRRKMLSAAAPSADPQFLNAIAAADRFWGQDELWRDALQSQHAGTTAAAEPTTETVAPPEDTTVGPATATIARDQRPRRGVSAWVRPSRWTAAAEPAADPNRERRVRHSVARQVATRGGQDQVLDHPAGVDRSTAGSGRGSGVLVWCFYRIHAVGPVVSDQRR